MYKSFKDHHKLLLSKKYKDVDSIRVGTLLTVTYEKKEDNGVVSNIYVQCDLQTMKFNVIGTVSVKDAIYQSRKELDELIIIINRNNSVVEELKHIMEDLKKC